ncbi:PQQ-dependent sugar dehydrogenase [Agrococcus carbonis]|uniref:Glucose/arabinose dehydrogenase, beta-propeller fold n=1 Tax=Agrococcus carbonis TaxID=684552 RepID=A0A1H1STA4_9MICO|nr:PQQ-dependent sugar dehydrogenase [Agrococcus carbonis]SDS51073.1 Glucose/arabinose dehydrogenase, beta-propeller fold [Agrococcus carbonis]
MRGPRRAAVGALAAVAALALVACGIGSPPPGPDATGAGTAASEGPGPSGSGPAATAAAVPPGTLDAPAVLATGLSSPWSVVPMPGGGALVSERDTARILEVSPAGAVRELARIDGVAPRGEAGLLGLAIADGHLYWYATARDGNAVSRARLTGSPGARELGAPEAVIAGIPATSFHDGGRIAFGPDGMLYVTTGDAGDPSAAQDRDSLAGKILRLEPDGAIPADNPFPGSPVYTLGHRNPQGLAWDDDGTMWATEFGQDTWDELNRIDAGANYGWPEVEGAAGSTGFADPVQQWRPAEASPSGIAIAGGSIWIAHLRGAALREVPLADPGTSTVHWQGRYGRLRDVATAPDGSLWMLTSNTDGRGSPAEGDDRILLVSP